MGRRWRRWETDWGRWIVGAGQVGTTRRIGVGVKVVQQIDGLVVGSTGLGGFDGGKGGTELGRLVVRMDEWRSDGQMEVAGIRRLVRLVRLVQVWCVCCGSARIVHSEVVNIVGEHLHSFICLIFVRGKCFFFILSETLIGPRAIN